MQWSSDWWRRNGWTLAILLSAFALAFAIRTIWTYPIVAQWGALYTYAGGSDSYYHSRVMQYLILNHTNLVHDPLLKFPFGAINPREPLFDWMNAILGITFAPLFGGNATAAGAWFLDLQGPLWAALSVFPVYLIGKEVSSRRMGLIAALIFPFLPASIDSSIFGYANYLSFYTFVILVVLYSWIRTIKTVGSRRYVVSYRDPKQIYAGLRAFLREERLAVKWAVFTGVSLGALALAWQGYTYGVVVIGISVFIMVIAERIRRVDSFGLYVATWIVGLVGFPMAIPYYVAQSQFDIWFGLPLLLFFGVLALLLPFLLMRDFPWVVSIPVLVGLAAAAVGVLAVVSPSYFTSIVTGQGYFVKNLIYSTVAEAQAPSIDQLVIGYGVVTFFVAFIGIALFVYQLVRGRFQRYHVAFLVFAILSVYLPISAAKFFLLGSPAFALLPAEAIRRALDVAGYPELRRTVASLSDRRSQLGAFRRAFKIRHVLVMLLVVGILLPNVWISVDAGIPGNTKGQFSAQVANSLPSFLKPSSGSASSQYFGAAGTSLDTPNQYDSAGYNWLATQDQNIPAPQRPAFVSWWDYGFQAIDQGQHPSVADNFQNGIDPAGQFLLAQNESLGIGILATTLLQAEQRGDALQYPYLSPSLNRLLVADGLNVTELHTLLVNTSADLPLVINHPEKYLAVNPHSLTADNAMYLAMSYFLADSLPLSGVAKVYDDVQQYTGKSIRYAMADTRLFPFSGTDTGIFYAPADLTGRVISAAGLPTSFFNVTVLASNGQTYPLGQVPAGVSPVNYSINYFAPFYQSFIYRTYIGYNGSEIGQGGGIPGLTTNLASSPLMPAWMLQHFEVVYRTAYVCDQKDHINNTGCYVAQNLPTAVSIANKTGGRANTSAIQYFSGGESMIEYYPGQTYLGTVQLADGTPVSGVRVTVSDQWGIPHMTTFTASDGSFSVVLPPGNDTLNVTTGTLQGLTQQGNILLRSLKIYVPDAIGLNPSAPTQVGTLTLGGSPVSGVVYWNLANNTTFVPSKDRVIAGAQVLLWGPDGLRKIVTTTDGGGTFGLANVPPGVYNYSILFQGHNYTQSSVFVHAATPTNASAGLGSSAVFGSVHAGRGLAGGTSVSIAGANGSLQSLVTNSSGTFRFGGLGPGNYTLSAYDPTFGLRSAGVRVSILAPSTYVHENLTIGPTATLRFLVTAQGSVAGGIPVRFVPLPDFSNASRPPLGSLLAAATNSTVVVSSSSGLVTANLPVGNYSVYALGYVDGALLSALTSASAFPGLPSNIVPLPLATSARLSGTLVGATNVGNTSRGAVLVYGAGLAEVTSWPASNGSYSLVLPLGNYSVLGLVGPSTAAGGSAATLDSVALAYPTSLRLVPSASIPVRFVVGATGPRGGFVPAVAASVRITAGPGGPGISTLATANGTVSAYLPSTLPLSAGSYCVVASSAGFTGSSVCDYTPSGLGRLSTLTLGLDPIDVTLTVQGLPSGTPVSVQLNATSVSATSQTFQGGPVFHFTTTPGTYTVSARATIGNGSTVYLPSSLLNTTLPFGAVTSQLTLILVPAINATGRLVLPPGGTLANTTVSLTSSMLNVSVNGTAFTSSFLASPGAYTAHVTTTVGNATFTNLTQVNVSASGTISPKVYVTSPAVTLNGGLVDANGTAVPLNTTVTFTAPDGSRTQASAVDGSFSVPVRVNTTFGVYARTTVLSAGPNGSVYLTWTTVPGANCTVLANSGRCAVTVGSTPNPVWLNGTLSAPGVPGPISGSVRLVGPYPSSAVTTVTASDGTFAIEVMPGSYSVYASGGGGSAPLANLTTVVALPSSGNVTLRLLPTWSVSVSVSGPNGSSATLGPATVIVRDLYGDAATFSGVGIGAPVPISLPAGRYTVAASAVGAPYGVATDANGSESVVLGTGNLAVTVPLSYQFQYRVGGTLVGPPSETVVAGRNVTVQFSVRNTGNAPVAIHPSGSPSYWPFTFSFGNVTLSPGAAPLAASVVIHVPGGTPVNHPGILLEFLSANGSLVGSVAPSPTIHVVGYYGLGVGTPSSPGAQVGISDVLVPFYLANTGNLYETVSVQLLDVARVQALGWTYNVTSALGKAVSAGAIGEAAGANDTYFLNFSATSRIFAPIGSVTISGTVLNASGAVQASATLGVPTASVRSTPTSSGAPFAVTGPSVGSPPSEPTWLVPALSFVPAAALLVGFALYRWNRTRRWTRR